MNLRLNLPTRIGAAIAAGVVCASASLSVAQPIDKTWDNRGFEHQKIAFEAMQAGDYAKAEAEFRKQIELQQTNFVPWYNLACALSMQDKVDDAWEALRKAVELGFDRVTLLDNDPQLNPLRDDPRFINLIDKWDLIRETRSDQTLEILQKQYGPTYTYEKDEQLRLIFASAFSDVSFAQAKREMYLLAAWGSKHVFYNLPAPDTDTNTAAPDSNEDNKTPEKVDAWVSVVLPNAKDFMRWAVSIYGSNAITGTQQIGGSYLHDQKQLVSQNLGTSLRHEYFHVLHWRSNERAGNLHAVWVQEGLCSLVEDFDIMPDGDLVIRENYRTNTARRLARLGKLMPIETLAEMERDRFNSTRPLANYAMARTFFYYLYRQGKLGEWYRVYDETYRADPSGITAITRVLGDDLTQVNREYQQWVRNLNEVSEAGRIPGAALGLDTDAGNGEGLTIKAVRNRSARTFRRNDVLVSVDGRNVRDLNELYRVLGDYEPGDIVDVVVLRRGKEITGKVTLQRP